MSAESGRAYEQFETIAVSVAQRLRAMKASDAALWRLVAAYRGYQVVTVIAREHPLYLDPLLRNLRKINPDDLEILDREYARSTVIAAIAVLDTFVSDLTKFLLLMHPSALPKERQVKIADVVTAESLASLLDTVVGRFVHELSYGSLADRLRLLTQKFGVTADSVPGVLESLSKHSALRNELVHNVSSFTYFTSETAGFVRAKQRESLAQPTWDEAEAVVNDCLALVGALFESASKEVFKRELDVSSQESKEA